MEEGKKPWYRLPVTEKKLKEEVDRYFERCGEEGTPPTPSGLALALGVRTSALSDPRLSIIQRNVIDRAMQRIEASTMEMMLTRGGLKGMESVLERVEESGEEIRTARDEVRRLTDEELKARLKRIGPRIEAALKGE